jgi:hypothetical protein
MLLKEPLVESDGCCERDYFLINHAECRGSVQGGSSDSELIRSNSRAIENHKLKPNFE